MTVDMTALRAQRLARLRATMTAHGLEALVVFEYANGRYAADLRPLYAPNFLVRQAVVVTTTADDVICFVHQDDTPHRRQVMTWLDPANVREFPTGVMLEGGGAAALAPIGDALRQLGHTGGPVGTDIGTPNSLANLTDLIGSPVVDANAALHQARSVKFPVEIELLRRASAVVDEALRVAVDAVRPGILECEILAEVMRVFYRHGAEVPQCNLIVCTGQNTAPMQRFAGRTPVAEGDIVFMDVGACFDGMFSEATRTVACGEPNPRQRAVYRAVHDLHEAMIGDLAPGRTAAEMQATAGRLLDAGPYRQYLQKMIVAHGIGVGYAEPPFVAPPGRPTPDLEFQPGTVLAVVPTIIVPGVPGGAGVRLEDVVTVTATGVERLTTHPYDAALLA